MSDKELDLLLRHLARPKVAAEFCSADEFKQRFRQNIHAMTVRRRLAVRRWSVAALVLLALGCGVIWRLAAVGVIGGRTVDGTLQLKQLAQFFERDVGVVFVGSELLIGERASNLPAQNVFTCQVDDPKSGEKLNLAFAGADNDCITVNDPELSGEIVFSRCDELTVVADVALKLKNQTVVRCCVTIPAQHGTEVAG